MYGSKIVISRQITTTKDGLIGSRLGGEPTHQFYQIYDLDKTLTWEPARSRLASWALALGSSGDYLDLLITERLLKLHQCVRLRGEEGEEPASGHSAIRHFFWPIPIASQPDDRDRDWAQAGVKSSLVVSAIPIPDFPLSTFQIPEPHQNSSSLVGFCPIRKLGESRRPSCPALRRSSNLVFIFRSSSR